MEGLIVIVILGSIIGIPVLLTGRINLHASSTTTFNWLEDAYWEYVSGEKGRGSTRHT